MKVYKQKYAGSANTAPVSAAPEHANGKTKNYQKGGIGGKKRYNGKGANRQNQQSQQYKGRPAAKPAASYNKNGAQKPQTAKPAKQGLFAKIKSLFSKK